MPTVLVTVVDFAKRCTQGLQFLEERGCRVVGTLHTQQALSDAQLTAYLAKADAVISSYVPWEQPQFAKAPQLKALATFGVGVDNINLNTARGNGVKVINAPGGNADSVAEFTIGMMIALLRDIVNMAQTLREGGWSFPLDHDIGGKTVGLLGFGDIARRVARRLSGFGVTLIAHCRHPQPELARQYGVEMVDMDTLFAKSDILSLHAPSTPQTRHLVNEARLASMKRGAWLINTARGALVDEAALVAALQSGQLAGAALDVFEVEPTAADNPLRTMKNVICAPHAASETWDSYERIGLMVAQDIWRVLQGQAPNNWVNR